MIRIRVACIFFSLLGTLISCQEEAASPKEIKIKKPNIILIMADDQGWGDLGHSGNTNISTPNIDAIARNGVSFENFYVQPVCSPTRAELLVGRYFSRLGVYSTSTGGERMNLGETTIAEVFKSAGYHTAAFGKWHNGIQPPYHPNARGFDDFYGFCSGHWGNYFSPMLEHNGKIVKGEGFLSDDLTNRSLEFIDKHKNEPLFIYLPFNTPHGPMQVPGEFWNRFKDKTLENLYQGDKEESLDFTRAALAMVENIDYNVGRIMAKIRQLDLEDNTIVVYLSDNGPNSWRWNGGMRGRKGSTNEGGVRAPFFIQWKNSIPAGKSVCQIAGAIDILPTLSGLAGIEAPTKKPLDGKDLKPLLFDDNPAWQERFIYNHWNGKTSIRSQDYRLDDQNRLYDMQVDRGQTTDISELMPVLLDSMKQVKTNWIEEVARGTTGKENKPFSLGYPDFTFTQLPARDGIPHGNIERSARSPNCTFFTGWKSVKDSITWDVNVLADGQFEVELYYTCTQKNLGSTVQLSLGESKIEAKITDLNNPPLMGMENDRIPRTQSYVKDFKPLKMGNMLLKKGQGTLTLKALNIIGDEAIDVRLLLFNRINQSGNVVKK